MTFLGSIEMKYWAKMDWIYVWETFYDLRMIENMKLSIIDQ